LTIGSEENDVYGSPPHSNTTGTTKALIKPPIWSQFSSTKNADLQAWLSGTG